jgi:hypothetical protein
MKYVIVIAALLGSSCAAQAESYAASTNRMCQESFVKNTKTFTVGRIEKTCRCATAMILDRLTPAEVSDIRIDQINKIVLDVKSERTDKLEKVILHAISYCAQYAE